METKIDYQIRSAFIEKRNCIVCDKIYYVAQKGRKRTRCLIKGIIFKPRHSKTCSTDCSIKYRDGPEMKEIRKKAQKKYKLKKKLEKNK